jgi:RNA polymerase sigma factor (TIGR02999 family)
MDEELAGLVGRWSDGDQAALGQLVDLLYDELRRLAHSHLQHERTGHTLSTTALVHEAYVQLSELTGLAWRGRARFFALVSKVMRHVLVDYARRRHAAKRGGGELRVPLTDDLAAAEAEAFELLAVDQALDRLGELDARLARIVECRFFGGMSEAEIAEALDLSTRTVERDWIRARAHLFRLLREARPPGGPPE